MKFSEAPVDSILVVGNTADGPILARKIEVLESDEYQPMHNAHWVDASGNMRGICFIMEDQQVEIYSTDTAVASSDKPAKPKRGTGKRAGMGSSSRGMPAASSDSGGEGMG